MAVRLLREKVKMEQEEEDEIEVRPRVLLLLPAGFEMGPAIGRGMWGGVRR
jgi:hypothetical protein